MSRTKIIVIFSLIVLAVASHALYTTYKNQYRIWGVVLSCDGKRILRVPVRIYEGGVELQKVETDSEGEFSFEYHGAKKNLVIEVRRGLDVYTQLMMVGHQGHIVTGCDD